MGENDYIAEYIKEKHPKLLGLDFIMWKAGRIMVEAFKPVVEFLRTLDWKEVNKNECDRADEDGQSDERQTDCAGEDSEVPGE